MSMQNDDDNDDDDDDDDTDDDWLIDWLIEPVAVDLLSCYLEFKYAMSHLVYIRYVFIPTFQQRLLGSWCLPATFRGNGGLGTFTF